MARTVIEAEKDRELPVDKDKTQDQGDPGSEGFPHESEIDLLQRRVIMNIA
jgi:hypothetical protein